MTLTAAGFTGQVNQVQWAQVLSLIGNDGTTGFDVTRGGSLTTLEAKVSPGMSNVGGVLAVSDAEETVTFNSNGSVYPRIDRVILRADWPSQSLTLTVEPGTPQRNPQPPDLSSSREAGVRWKVSLAQVRLESGHGEVTAGDITREATPPATGFYRVASIAEAPRHNGALYYYTAERALYFVDGDVHQQLTERRTNAFVELPDPPPNWTGNVRYIKCNRWVTVTVDLRRSGSGTDGNNVYLGRLPTGYRPPNGFYGVCVNEQSGRACPLQVAPDGDVRALSTFIATEHRMRGGVTFPLD